MKLSIITVTYNSNQEIIKLLKSLSEVVLQNGLDAETLIWDNASTDGTTTSLLRFPGWYPELNINLRLNPKNVGLSKALNEELSHATGDLILFCNPDVILNQTFLELLDFVRSHPNCGAVPEFFNSDGSIQKITHRRLVTMTKVLVDFTILGKFVSKVFPWIDDDYHYKDMGSFFRPWKIEQPGGSCLLMSREDVTRLSNPKSFYDEQFPVFWNDVDLAMRAREEGINFALVPSVRVYHSLGHSVRKIEKEFSTMLFYSSKGLMGFARKWGFSTTTIQVVLFLDAVFGIGIQLLTSLKKRHSLSRRPRERVEIAKNITRTLLLKYRCSLQ